MNNTLRAGYIPNESVWNHKESTESYINIFQTDKVVPFMYALSLVTNYGECSFSIKGLLEMSQLPIRKDTICEYKHLIKEMCTRGLLIPIGSEKKEPKVNDWLRFTIKYMTMSEDGKFKEYYILNEQEYGLIMGYKSSSISNSKLLILYSYLSARMHRRNGDPKIKTISDASLNAYKEPEVCYPSLQTMEVDLGIKDTSLMKYIDILTEIDLIRWANAGQKHKKILRQTITLMASNCYALFSNSTWEIEIEAWINNYKISMKKQGWKFLTKSETDIVHKRRSLTNRMNRLEGIRKVKGLTEEQEKVFADAYLLKQTLLRDSRETKRWELKNLLSQHAGKLLSEIFSDICLYGQAMEYHALELKLGLISDDDLLLVPYEYYSWAISHCHEMDLDFLRHSIQKKIRDEQCKIINFNKQNEEKAV